MFIDIKKTIIGIIKYKIKPTNSFFPRIAKPIFFKLTCKGSWKANRKKEFQVIRQYCYEWIAEKRCEKMLLQKEKQSIEEIGKKEYISLTNKALENI